MFEHITIVGLGLIGGSIAQAVRQFDIAKNITAIDPNVAHYSTVEKYITNLEPTLRPEHLKRTQLLVLAGPIASIIETIKTLNNWSLPPSLMITDTASIKSPIIDAAHTTLKAQYVPAHPIAGSEKSGFSAAHADLFLHKKLILTPLSETHPNVQKSVHHFWFSMGCRIIEMNPNRHDKVYALTSHLPHFLAFMQAHHLKDDPDLVDHCGAGLTDFIRIAGSDPELWTQIFLHNPYFQEILAAFTKQLNAFEALIHHKEKEQILNALQCAQAIKNKISP